MFDAITTRRRACYKAMSDLYFFAANVTGKSIRIDDHFIAFFSKASDD